MYYSNVKIKSKLKTQKLYNVAIRHYNVYVRHEEGGM